MSDLVLVEATFADLDEAERIAAAAIEEGLAACANLLPCSSIYRWDGKVERGDEVIGRFKTSGIRARRLVERIVELHSYELPAIVTLGAAADEAVADWVRSATR